MKTAISIPDDLFARAELLADHMKTSRSRLFSHALEEYINRHAADSVTETMDRVCSQIEPVVDPFVTTASARILSRSEW